MRTALVSTTSLGLLSFFAPNAGSDSHIPGVCSWFDHIQHLRSLSKKVAEFGLNVEISQKVAEPKKEEPKKEEPKKQEAKKPEGEKVPLLSFYTRF